MSFPKTMTPKTNGTAQTLHHLPSISYSPAHFAIASLVVCSRQCLRSTDGGLTGLRAGSGFRLNTGTNLSFCSAAGAGVSEVTPASLDITGTAGVAGVAVAAGVAGVAGTAGVAGLGAAGRDCVIGVATGAGFNPRRSRSSGSRYTKAAAPATSNTPSIDNFCPDEMYMLSLSLKLLASHHDYDFRQTGNPHNKPHHRCWQCELKIFLGVMRITGTISPPIELITPRNSPRNRPAG